MDEGLLLEEKLPVSLERVRDFPESFPLSLINESNEWFLKAHFVLHESIEIDEHDEVRLELRRLDLKMNLLIEMVGELLTGQNRMPDPSPIVMTPAGIDCRNEAGLKAGDKVIVSLYINPAIPKPLRLLGVVESLQAGGRLKVGFTGLTQPVRDWLEKLIFRHHRKAVAQSRSKQE